MNCLILHINYSLHHKWLSLNSRQMAEDITRHFVGFTQETRQDKETVNTTHSLIFLLYIHSNSEPHTIPCMQYMNEITLLKLLNPDNHNNHTHCIWTANFEFMRRETKSIQHSHALKTTGNALAKTNAHPKKPMNSVHLYTLGHFTPENVSQGTNKHVQNGNLHKGTKNMRLTGKWRIGIKKGHGSGCQMETLYEVACTLSGIKYFVHVWVTDWWKGLVQATLFVWCNCRFCF